MMAVHHHKLALVKWAIQQGADVNAINFAGVCALHICCHETSVSHDMVDVLLDHGASTEIADANGCTVLHYAASAGDALSDDGERLWPAALTSVIRTTSLGEHEALASHAPSSVSA